MRKYTVSGVVIVTAFLATTVSGRGVVPQGGGPGRVTTSVGGDVIVIGDCRVGVTQKADVACPRTGQLRWLGLAEVDLVGDNVYRFLDVARQKDVVPANRDILTVDVEILPGQNDPEGRKVYTEKTTTGERRFFRRYFIQLMEGDRVVTNQRIGQLDDRVARAELSSKEAKYEASKADVDAARKTMEEAKERFDTAQNLVTRGGISQEDYRAARVTHERYKAEYLSKGKMVDVAREELSQARVLLHMHEITSPFNGVVKVIYKNFGEAVREQEPVLQIHSLDRLRIEGLVDAQFRDRIRPGMKVVLEAPHRFAPRRTLKGHLQEITAVAVTNHKSKPLIVSASEDGTLRVWDSSANSPEIRRFTHPKGVAFRSVACSPEGAQRNLVLAGSADGVVWIYDLDREGEKELHKLEGGHRQAVASVAFGPQGNLAVSAGEDRSFCIWECETGKQRPAPDAKILGGVITGVQFASTGTIVSTARDNKLRVWSPSRDGKYDLSLTVPRRSGDVSNLGVSPNGKHVLFDQGKELRILSLPEGQYAGSIMNPTGTSAFTTMALFSPKGNLVLTTGSAEGRLQLWHLPANGTRGEELAHLIPTERSIPTSGAFAPNNQFLVTGTKDRVVCIWDMPSEVDLKERIEAEVMHVDPAIESGGRQMRIRADAWNRNGRLMLNDTVTMVIHPR